MGRAREEIEAENNTSDGNFEATPNLQFSFFF
jgi:hypothetical protein